MGEQPKGISEQQAGQFSTWYVDTVSVRGNIHKAGYTIYGFGDLAEMLRFVKQPFLEGVRALRNTPGFGRLVKAHNSSVLASYDNYDDYHTKRTLIRYLGYAIASATEDGILSPNGIDKEKLAQKKFYPVAEFSREELERIIAQAQIDHTGAEGGIDPNYFGIIETTKKGNVTLGVMNRQNNTLSLANIKY